MTLSLIVAFSSALSTIGYVLLAILCLMFMVVVHELGHYIAGKALGFKINEFAIGFGPALLKKTNKKNGEVFSLRAVPLGGFCMFEGEEDDEDKKSSHPRAFNELAPWKRLIVLFSGAFSNFLSSIILITILFTFYGQILPTVHNISPESQIYEQDALKECDVILKVNGDIVNILTQDDIDRNMAKLKGDSGTLTVLRNGKRIKTTIQRSTVYERDQDNNIVLDENGAPKTKFAYGFTVGVANTKLNFFHAFGRAFSYSFFLVYKILFLLGQLITGKLSFAASAGGPVTVIKAMSNAGRSGFGSLLFVVCIISANLAVMNLLPLPALDGSKMVFTTIEWVRGKPINRKIENVIHLVGFVLLIAVAIFADVIQFIS